MKIFSTLLAATAACVLAAPSLAASLALDTGWLYDQTDSLGAASEDSPLEFTLTGSAFFRLTDSFTAGDVYTISDAGHGILASSTFTTDGATVDDFFGVSWSDTSYSRLSMLLGPGTYSITVTGDCGAGCPAGLGVRLDSAAAVPEPASWAMMVGGFGLAGGAMRRRSRSSVAYA